ncbi:hypothetical protein [Geodermatophilus sp. URMC 62]|uniref:hypothetical protein n=1 Tax=Geodermatophilus sp. URMC 62 TaxID=3423414 RepID=UPI00406D3026
MTTPALLFLAPPSSGYEPDDDRTDTSAPPPPRDAAPGRSAGRHREPGRQEPAGGLRMTRGAREAATGMGVSDADVQRCLDAPDDVSPDERTPSRTRFRRGGLVVLAGADGMVLRVARRGR